MGGLELVILVGDTFYGWWRRVGGFISIDVGRWAAGVFVGGLRIWGVRVLTSTDGFPDTGGVELGVFDLLESLEVGKWGCQWRFALIWFSKMHSELPLGQGRRRLCRLREESRQLIGCRRFG